MSKATNNPLLPLTPLWATRRQIGVLFNMGRPVRERSLHKWVTDGEVHTVLKGTNKHPHTVLFCVKDVHKKLLELAETGELL